MLRQQVEKIKQSAYEDPREFGLHFSNAVGQAYTMTQQAVDVVQERLVAQFINGLRNVVVRHQVYLGSPKILAAAIEMTSTTAGAFQLADVERKGEPMDIGAIGFVTTKPVQPQLSEVAESITALRHELTAVKQRLDALPTAEMGQGRGWPSGCRGQPNGRTPGWDRTCQTTATWPAIGVDHVQWNCEQQGQQRIAEMEAAIAAPQTSLTIRKTPEGTRQALYSVPGVQSALSHNDWLWCLQKFTTVWYLGGFIHKIR